MRAESTRRVFDPTLVDYGDKRVRGFKAQCVKCGFVDKQRVNNIKGHADNEEQEAALIRQKFIDAGWTIAHTPARDCCPRCAREESHAKSTMKIIQGGQQSMQPQKPAVAPPREMTREDRRIIFEKLNEVYVSEAVGYGETWTDAKVASDLGVPRAWVATIRDENFGPPGNSGVLATIEEAKKNLTEAKAIAADFDKIKVAMADLARRVDVVSANVTVTTRTINDLEKAMR